MTVTTTTLTRAAGLSAVVAGLLFIAVQINHPPLDVTFVTTAEWTLRESGKVLFAVLGLAGITGMYLRQLKQSGVLGLLGYLVLGAGFLLLLGIQVIGVVVLPALAASEPGYVADALAVAAGHAPTGNVGLLRLLGAASGATYIGGGILFGVALLRAGVLARWASALLAVAALATAAIPFVPQVNPRLFAIPVGIALIGLGYSLWRDQRTPSTRPAPSQLDRAGAA